MPETTVDATIMTMTKVKTLHRNEPSLRMDSTEFTSSFTSQTSARSLTNLLRSPPSRNSTKSTGSLSDFGGMTDKDDGGVFIYNPRSSFIPGNSPEEIRSAFPRARLSPPKQLYGRQTEKEAIVKAITVGPAEDTTTTTASTANRVVLVSGSSGTGKTALVEEATKELLSSTKNQHVCIRGKYDFSQRQQVPYSGITAALRQLCQRYLEPTKEEEGEDNGVTITREQKEELRQALGSSAKALESMLPDLAKLIDLEEEKNSSSSGMDKDGAKSLPATATVAHLGEAPQRFRFAIQTFFRTIASWNAPYPIVMILDDLQFADAESFRLLESLMETRTTTTQKQESSNSTSLVVIGSYSTSLVVIGCYRDNGATVRLANWILGLGEKKNCTAHITRVSLSNLTLAATGEMLADVLHMDAADTRDLAAVVHAKTLGNPFFVLEFLKSIQRRNILSFNLLELQWHWNMDELRAKTEATDNVVEHMQRNMQCLPTELYEFLPLAACLGSTFSSHKLEVVLSAFQKDGARKISADHWLGACAELGFILPIGDALYNWVHDKIQEASLSLVPEGELEGVQFRVGQVLLANLSKIEIRENILVVVNLLIKGLPTRENIPEEERLVISQLCLEAGHTTMASASFSQAGVYLEVGINFLPDSHWVTSGVLSLELFTSAAEAASCAGESERIQRYCSEVIAQEDISMTEKFRAYDVLMPFTWGKKKDYEGALEMGLHVLDDLDCKLPKKILMAHVLSGIVKMKRAMKNLGPDAILSHKEMTDHSKIQSMIMLHRLASVAYNLRSPYLALTILKSFNLSLKYGISEYSPGTFALVALILMTQLKDFELSRTWATFAVSLIESRPECEVSKCRTLFLAHGFVLHASIPYQNCQKKFLEAYKSGCATGDVENACWSAMNYLNISFFIGKNLLSLDEDWAVYTKQMDSFSQSQAFMQSNHLWQVAQNLIGRAADPLVLKGEAFVFDVADFTKLEIPTIVFIYHCQIYLAYFMCDDTNGAKVVLDFYSKYTTEQMDPGTFLDDYLQGHAAVLCYSSARKKKKSKYISRGRKCHKHIQTIGKKGNPNLSPIEKLLDAEYAALNGRKTAAKSNYEAAIALAARRGLVNEQANINERFADFLTDCMRDHTEACYRLKCAIDLYTEWGATIKVKRLRQKMTAIAKEYGVTQFNLGLPEN